jgi:hypothetical protein
MIFTGVCSAEVRIAEPEYVGNVIAVQSATGVDLEKQRASNHARSGLFRAASSNIVQRAKSPVRLSSAEALQFIVRAESNAIDPTQLVNIFQLISDPGRDYRYIQTGTQGMFTSSSMAIDFLPFTGKQYGKSSYLLTISQPLDAGEYAITLDGSRDVFNMFGID